MSFVASAGKLDPSEVQVIGATAWGFSHECLSGTLDVLFVDEAGQLL